jgi:hypothetical protein
MLPHLRTVICGTGVGDFANQWAMRANNSLLAGIENLDYHTPGELRSLWAQHLDRAEPAVASLTTTVYQFGVSEITAAVVGFAYRSTADFESERLPSPAVGLKPPDGVTDGMRTGESFGDLVLRMRAHQDSRPPEERAYIGGELLLCTLTKDGRMEARPVHRFDDADEAMDAAIAAFQT